MRALPNVFFAAVIVVRHHWNELCPEILSIFQAFTDFEQFFAFLALQFFYLSHSSE